MHLHQIYKYVYIADWETVVVLRAVQVPEGKKQILLYVYICIWGIEYKRQIIYMTMMERVDVDIIIFRDPVVLVQEKQNPRLWHLVTVMIKTVLLRHRRGWGGLGVVTVMSSRLLHLVTTRLVGNQTDLFANPRVVCGRISPSTPVNYSSGRTC